MSKQSAGKVVSYNESLVSEVELLAATDANVKAALTMSVDAGKVYGAAVHTSTATEHFKVLADTIAASIADARVDDDDDKAAGGAKRFRLLVGMANASIRAAQTTAKRLAIGQHKAAEMSSYAKKARDRIVKLLDRQLAIYGLEVDWQAVTYADVDPSEGTSDEDRAAKAIAGAFKLSGAGALAGVLALPNQTLIHLANALQVEIARQAVESTAAKLAGKRDEVARTAEQVRALKAQMQPDSAAVAQGVATVRALFGEWRTARRMHKAALDNAAALAA